ncbi:MAG TPA: hypothetical protein VFB14_04535 [Bryobacteraceae bacterium]|nr:hypothetical protein [Bryobacteraceae bacterium]
MEDTTNPSQRLVFISHSSKDTWIAKQIAREIGQRGAIPFRMRLKSMQERISKKIF